MRFFLGIYLMVMPMALVPSGKVEAAFKGSNGEEQCYALQYEASELKMVKGDIAQGYAAVFSTAEVCANTDASGKVVGKLYDGASQPSGTTELKKAKLTKGDTTIFLYTSSKANAEPKSFAVDKYDTFKDLVKAVNDAAPAEYTVTNIFSTAAFGSKMKKTAFDADYKTTSEVREEVTEAAAAINSGDANTVAAMCQEAGLKGLSWVACPVMDGTAQTISALDAMIGSWLAVDTAFYSGESATYEVWSVMRDIANVALVVVLLIIIFSQLTGVGIDNYGIKKMLPRLIAMAILINLSFIACQLVIDISNILGVSLNTLFRSVGARVMPDDAAIGNFLATAITTMFAMVGVTGSIGGTALAVVGVASTIGAPVMVVIILLALIPVIAAVLLFFVMLGARMTLVIALTAIAPVVAVLYVLPNTQKWAKKWWNLFFAILVMYPLCGAIAGISYLIKAMVLSMEGPHLWMMIIGVIGPFLPFFLLPTLLKNAVSMLGAAGDALVAMGQGWRRGISRGTEAVQNTERFKNAAEDAREMATAERARRVQAKFGERRGELNQRQLRRLRRADDTLVAHEANQLKDDFARSDTNYRARVAAMNTKAYEEGLDQDIALLRENGIRAVDGNGDVQTYQYNLDGINARLNNLRNAKDADGNRRALTTDERREVAVLTRAALGEKGGGGVVGGIMRNRDGAGTSDDFKMAMGDALQQDTASRMKFAEKDAAASHYAESFMKNGENYDNLGAGGQASTFEEYRGAHGEDINKRIRTYEVGLGQSGAALDEYINSLTAQECENIYDTDAYRVLGREDLAKFQAHAGGLGVTGKRAQRVTLDNGNGTNGNGGVPSGFTERDSGLIIPHDTGNRR